MSAVFLGFFACGAESMPPLPEGLRWENPDSYADEEPCLVLHFEEPVMPLSATEEETPPQPRPLPLQTNGAKAAAAAPAAEDSSPLIISGDESFLPKVSWLDQNRLKLSFPLGYSLKTLYTLRFKPGQCYLSGKPLPSQVIAFRGPQPRFCVSCCFGAERPTLLLYPANFFSREAQAFGLETAGEFFAHRMQRPLLGAEMKAFGKPIPLEKAALPLKWMPEPLWRVNLHKKTDFSRLGEDSPMAGGLLLRFPEGDWKSDIVFSLSQQAEGGSFDWKPLQFSFSYPKPFISRQWREDASGMPRISLGFDAPMRREAAEALFRGLRVEADGWSSRLSEDGKELLLDLPSGCLKLRLAELTPAKEEQVLPDPETAAVSPYRYRESKDCYVFSRPDLYSALQLDVEGPLPRTPLSFYLPSDLRLADGYVPRLQKPLCLSLSPAEPALYDGAFHSLPLHGSHCFRVETLNAAGLEVAAYYWGAKELPAIAPKLSLFRQLSRGLSAEFALRVEEKRPRSADRSSRIAMCRKAWEREKEQDAARAECLKTAAESRPARALPLAAGQPQSAAVRCSSAELDLDALLGETARPGLYILELRRTLPPEMQEALRSIGCSAAALQPRSYVLLELTDLDLQRAKDELLAYRHSDGRLVTQGRLSLYTADGSLLSSQDLAAGLTPMAEPKQARLLLLQTPDGDCCLRNSNAPYRPEADAARLYCRCDRPLYRPGDTLHFFACLRALGEGSGEIRLPKNRNMKLTILRPDSSVLETRDVQLDEFGCYSLDWRFPTGDEDVTGCYSIMLEGSGLQESCDVPCEIFRRDSMKAELTVTGERVAPHHVGLRVKAEDLNGMPVARGQLRLRAQVSSRDAEKNGEPLSWETELTLDAQGVAQWDCELPDFGAYDLFNLSFEAELANERQEYLHLSKMDAFHAAGLSISASLDRERLQLQLLGADGKPCAQERPCELRVWAQQVQESPLAAPYLRRRQAKEECLAELKLRTDARGSRELSLRELLPSLSEAVEKGDEKAQQMMRDLWVELRAADDQGRVTRKIVRPSYRRMPEREAAAQPTWSLRYAGPEPSQDGSIRAAEEPRRLVLEQDSPAAYKGYLLLATANGCRLLPWDVPAGRQSRELPLLPEEEGQLRAKLMLLRRGADGQYRLLDSPLESGCELPYLRQRLCLELSLPEKSLRPSEKLKVSGRVCDAAGKARQAQLLLYAVDEGMLSVASDDGPQDMLAFFSRRSQPSFSPCLTLATPMKPPSADYWRRAGFLPISLSGKPDEEEYSLGGLRMAKGCPASPMMANCELERSDEVCDGAPAALRAKGLAAAAAPRVRTDFRAVAFWQAAVKTDAEGRFELETKLPDTLTRYRLFAFACSESCFGRAQASFQVNQPLMLTAGCPFFMSTGDTLLLPLTVSNNTEKEGTWKLRFSASEEVQEIRLAPQGSGTLYFRFTAEQEGRQELRWTALGEEEGDAVQGSFEVLFPAPLLKETQRLVWRAGQGTQDIAALLAAELRDSPRGEMTLSLSANPLLHLAGCVDFLLNYPYGCSEQISSSLLPYLLYGRLAPFSPRMAALGEEEARRRLMEGMEKLWKRQQADGGLSYWDAGSSCLWASCHAGLLMRLAMEQGYAVPQEKFDALQAYLRHAYHEDSQRKHRRLSCLSLYALGRCLGDEALMERGLAQALQQSEALVAEDAWQNSALSDLRLIAELRREPAKRHESFLSWLRVRARDYRHPDTWQSSWMLLALYEYLRAEPASSASARLRCPDGTEMSLGEGMTQLRYRTPLAGQATGFTLLSGTVYATLAAKAKPEKTEYPAVTEHGLQITRRYEKKGADGVWREAKDFAVGDLVRITLSCAKSRPELRYFVLEDYLPSCMEAVNPKVPSQAAGIEFVPWSAAFDNREYLADRVRGFCTRWSGRDLLNMCYFARVKRAGSCTAPPAQAQLMYEPQYYGLSPNTRIQSR